MKKLIVLILFILPLAANASLLIQYSFFYHTNEDDAEDFAYSKMDNLLFFGASLDKKQQLFLGQSVYVWSKEHTLSDTSDISMTELGPRIIYFFNDIRTWYTAVAWHPYAKGDRTLATEAQEISGSAYLFTLGYQLKISRMVHMGASLNYHMLSISKYTVDTTETEVSESYTSIVPMLELSLRFR